MTSSAGQHPAKLLNRHRPILYSLVFTSLFLAAELFGADAETVIKKIEDNLNGESAVMEMAMTVRTRRGERTMKMKSYSVGTEKSFIRITYPGKDAGITFLKIDNTMWQYVPRIEKIIKIPASMMLQSWMGSDFSNDDLVKESSLSKDYTTEIIQEGPDTFTLLLIPREEAPVVWGKIEMEVSKEHYLPTVVRYYDEDDILIRILEYSGVTKLDDRFYPTRWIMLPQEEQKRGRQTVVSVESALFNTDISGSYFTKKALKKYSR